MQRDNINVILCDQVDDSLTNITNIIDVVTLNEESMATITAVIFINGIEWMVNKFTLYFFVEKLDPDGNKMAYIGNSEFQTLEGVKKRSNGSDEFGSRMNNSQSISEMKFENMYFPGPGAYELQIYKYENEEIVDLSNKSNEECIKYANSNNLVSAYAFEVK